MLQQHVEVNVAPISAPMRRLVATPDAIVMAYAIEGSTGNRYVIDSSAVLGNSSDHRPDMGYFRSYPVTPGIVAGEPFDTAANAERAALLFDSRTAAFPYSNRVGSHIGLFRGLLGVHSRCGLPARRTAKAARGFEAIDGFVTSAAAPIASGWSDQTWPGGICTHWNVVPYHGARLFPAIRMTPCLLARKRKAGAWKRNRPRPRSDRGSGWEAAIGRNRTCQKCSSPHGKGPHRLVGFGVDDAKARTRLILIHEEDAIGRVHGRLKSLRRFPRRGRTGTFQPQLPRKTQPGYLFGPETARAKPRNGNLCRQVVALLRPIAASLPLPQFPAAGARPDGSML